MHIPNEDAGLGKRRHAMPQIKDYDAFVEDLSDEGVAVTTIDIDPEELKPTQGNFNAEKVAAMVKDGSWKKNAIVTSDDDFVLDGHHRWLAAAQVHKDIKCRVVDMNLEDLLKFVKGKPYVETKTIDESAATQAAALARVQDYYTRVARGEGGTQFANLLTAMSNMREAAQANMEPAVRNRQQILVLIGKIEALLRPT